ncbi:MAG: DUF692 domain-containing protein [Sandaracinaceae bacterium]
MRGVGLAWRPETAWSIDRRPSVGFTEVIAESVCLAAPPAALMRRVAGGLSVVVHGVSLSLGSAEGIDPKRIDALARVAERLRAPLISEHIAFVRAGGHEIGHLTAVPRTIAMLEILIENVRAAMRVLPVPLALENIATLFEWPDDEIDEASFVRTLLDETGAWLLLDVSNLYANAINFGWDTGAYLDAIPLHRIAYVHVAGGTERGGAFVDTHAHPIARGSYALIEELVRRGHRPPVLLERDDRFLASEPLEPELDALEQALARRSREGASHVVHP